MHFCKKFYTLCFSVQYYTIPPQGKLFFSLFFMHPTKKQQKINKKQQEFKECALKVYSGFCLYSWGVLPVYRRKALWKLLRSLNPTCS